MRRIEEVGARMATAFGLNPKEIIWTYLNKWTYKNPELITGEIGLIWGQHFSLADMTDRKRVLQQTCIIPEDLPSHVLHVIAMYIQEWSFRVIEKRMIHELNHIIVPVYYMANEGKWSDIHRPAFERKLKQLYKTWEELTGLYIGDKQ